MDERLVLHAERDALEFRLAQLERVIEDRRAHGLESLDLAERMELLFARLSEVNELLAKMRCAMH